MSTAAELEAGYVDIEQWLNLQEDPELYAFFCRIMSKDIDHHFRYGTPFPLTSRTVGQLLDDVEHEPEPIVINGDIMFWKHGDSTESLETRAFQGFKALGELGVLRMKDKRFWKNDGGDILPTREFVRTPFDH